MEASKKMVIAIGAILAVGAGIGGGYVFLSGTPKAEVVKAAEPVRAVGFLEPVGAEDRAAAVKLVGKISQNQATVTEVFRGPTGFVGVVVNPGEHQFIAWMPASRDTLFVGAMFDQNGKNVTQAEMVSRGYARAELAPPTAAQPAQSIIKQAVDRSEGFVEGSGGPIVTAFVDYNCSFCQKLYQRSRQFVAQGKLRIKWVPVAILGDTSLPKAAAVLSYRDPITRMSDPVKGMHLAESGTLAPLTSVSAPMKTTIDANGAVLNLLTSGQAATPTLVVNKPDGTFDMTPGLPQDLMAFVQGTSQ